jgi:hypothetical protein
MPYVLNGLSYNFDTKIVTVLSPATTLDLQDFVNTTREVEAVQIAMDDQQIIAAGGKEPLGGGNLVGITVSLFNGWRVAFEARSGPNTIVCTISGGNLVAFVGRDSTTSTQFPVAPTAYTAGFIAQSSSATLSDQKLATETRFLIESLRSDHQATGTVYYVDPVDGDDLNDGLLPSTAVKTVTTGISKATSGEHDVIYIIASGITTITEKININKSHLSIRSTGTVVFSPLDDSDHTIKITSGHCALSGITITTAAGPTPRNAINAINVQNIRLDNISIPFASNHGIYIEGESGHQIERIFITQCLGDAIHMKDTKISAIHTARLDSNTGYGIYLESTLPGDNVNFNIDLVVINNNTAGNVYIGSGVVGATITASSHISTTPSRVTDNGINTQDALAISEDRTAGLAKSGLK